MNKLLRIGFWISFISITILAFLPDYTPLPDVVRISDKLNHLVAFLFLSILLFKSYNLLKSEVAILLIIYAFFIEIVQWFLPTRYFSFLDIIADSFGIFFLFLI